MLYILPPIQGISDLVLQIHAERESVILDYEDGDIYQEARRLGSQIEGVGHVLLGFSIGGLIAFEIARLFPTNIEKIITYSTRTHIRYIPVTIHVYKKMLPFVPSSLFCFFYQKRHPSVSAIPKKHVFQRRLDSVFCYDIPPFPNTFWVKPVGLISFGLEIYEEDLLFSLSDTNQLSIE